MLAIFTYPVAIILGFLAGLGVGGGSLLMVWLTMIIGMNYADARTINLLFFLPSAIISTLFRKKQGFLKTRKILPAIIAGCITAALFAVIGKHLNITVLKKVFGGLLLLTGLRELLYRARNAR